jgi:hypothetical protein
MPLFLIFWGVSYSDVATSTLDIHYFAWGLCSGRFLKLTGSLLAVELSCCDCVEIKVSRGNVPFPHWGSNPCLACVIYLYIMKSNRF